MLLSSGHLCTPSRVTATGRAAAAGPHHAATRQVSFSFQRGQSLSLRAGRRQRRGGAVATSASWSQEVKETEIRRKLAKLEEERSFAQKEAVEAIAELKAATAAVEASWSMAENAVKADDEQAARLLLENKAKKKEAMEKALKKAELKQAFEKKLTELIQALEIELIGLRSASNPVPPPPPPPKPYQTEEELSNKFLELERGDLEAQLKRELRARDIRPPGGDSGYYN